MNQLGWIAVISLGGACGAVARWTLASWINGHLLGSFPWATLCINFIGSLAFGLIYVWSCAHDQWRDMIRLLLLVGFLGAFTTFSTFSFETLKLFEAGKVLLAIGNIFASVIFCLTGAWAGLAIGKQIFN